MIKDLIVKLMEEANEEAEHKGWCDTELSTNKQTREDKADQVDTLTAQSEELSAQIAKLSNEITELSDAVAALDKAMAEATALRNEEQAKNAQTVKDAQAAQVLKEFYAKASEATALVQQTPGEDAPATFDKPYRGMGGSSTGVIGMIEVIASDFARLEAETNTAESEAAEQYQKFSDESAQDKAVKNMDIENKSKDRTTAEADLSDTKKDLEATQAELDAALAFFEKLKPSCVDMNLSYEDRVKQREEEIQSLNEALRILDGNDIA